GKSHTHPPSREPARLQNNHSASVGLSNTTCEVIRTPSFEVEHARKVATTPTALIVDGYRRLLFAAPEMCADRLAFAQFDRCYCRSCGNSFQTEDFDRATKD